MNLGTSVQNAGAGRAQYSGSASTVVPNGHPGTGDSEWGRKATVRMSRLNQGSVLRRMERATTVVARILLSALLLLVLWWMVSEGIRAI